ncbi:MAG: hypothetical protein MUF42_04805 [Cytophagaceae bacterium]|jgi:hypothetical protein|nr:hypothetical protein [Cytophagaceae bacterium]
MITAVALACGRAPATTRPHPTSAPMDTLTRYEQLNDFVGKNVWVEGILKMEKFTNKGGRILEFYEFWLEMNDGNSVLLRNVGEAMSKEPFTHYVRIKAHVFHGMLDTDDPNVQSRVGFRLDFTDVQIISRR